MRSGYVARGAIPFRDALYDNEEQEKPRWRGSTTPQRENQESNQLRRAQSRCHGHMTVVNGDQHPPQAATTIHGMSQLL